MTLPLVERVALAIEAANLEDGASYKTAAAAAIAVMLPDQKDFDAAVWELMKNCIRYSSHGNGTGNDEKNAAKNALKALVYGQGDGHE